MNTTMRDNFRDPPASYRGLPFWSWNGDLQEKELLRQIDVFKEMGMGGYFCHSRVGLVTEYLGEEWFRLINVCADYGEAAGMETWLYDEDRWPSGTAGGRVTETPEHRLHLLRLTMLPGEGFVWRGEGAACFTAEVDGLSFRDKHRLTPGEAGDGRTVLLFTVEEMAPSSFYNGNTYLDAMNPEAVDDFLRRTHAQYAAHCGGRLGDSIRGIFTDEPHHGAVMCGFSLGNPQAQYLTPWPAGFADAFAQAYGGDLLDLLPELFLWKDGERVHPVKWQYMELLEELFLRNYMQKNQEWCRAHGLQFTGHLLHEDTLTAQTAMIGSIARAYAYMDMPGVDVLGAANKTYWIAKQAQSACRQLGKTRLLSELYGVSGWDTRLENQKAIGDWQALFGVNRRCHHLSWYTMKGSAKRDFPASIGAQSAWYPDYRLVEEYFSRIHVFMEEGDPVCDLLVVTPVESVWCLIYPGWADTLTIRDGLVAFLENRYAETFYWLSGAKLDFDYGDEDFLARLGQVEEADGEVCLRVGRARYRRVLVAGMLTMRGTTLALLRDFASRGGKVVMAGDPPSYIDALPSEEAARLPARRTPFEREALLEAVGLPPAAAVTDAAGRPVDAVYVQARRDENRLKLFLLNTDWENGYAGCRVAIGWTGRWFCDRWDARSGEVIRLADGEGAVELDWDFAPDGELLLLVSPEETAAQPAAPAGERTPLNRPEGGFPYRLAEPNVCPLTQVRVQVEDEEAWPALDVLEADRRLRLRFQLEPRSGEALQPWFAASLPSPVLCRVTLEYEFTIDDMPAGLQLAMEAPDVFEARINGREALRAVPGGFWVDTAFSLFEIDPAALHPGLNRVTLTGPFHRLVDLEAVYLLGGFGVRAGETPALIRLPDRLRAGDIGEQGLPYYGASIVYRMEAPAVPPGCRLIAACDSMGGASCLRLYGEEGGAVRRIWAPPLTADITGLAAPSGELQVACVLTRHNTFEHGKHIPQGLPLDFRFLLEK